MQIKNIPANSMPAQHVLIQQYVAAVYLNGQREEHSHQTLHTQLQNGLPTLVMVHGWGADHRCFLPLVASLTRCNAVLIDLPGFGNNTLLEQDHYRVSAHITAFLPAISVLVGWSLGGMLLPIIAKYAEQNNKTVCGAISVAANTQFVQTPESACADNVQTASRQTNLNQKNTLNTMPYEHAMDDAQYTAFVDAFTHTPQALLKRFYRTQTQGDANARAVKATLMACAPDFTDLSDAVTNKQHDAWLHALLWLSRIHHTPYLAQSTLPMLHILGQHDALVPCAIAGYFDEAMHHQTVILQEASHAPHISNPSLVAQHITGFLHRVLGVNHIDKTQLARSFGQAATHYHQAAFFQKDMAQALCKQACKQACEQEGELTGIGVDLGCGTGFCSDILQRRIDANACKAALSQTALSQQAALSEQTAPSQLIALDISMGMLEQARKQLAQGSGSTNTTFNPTLNPISNLDLNPSTHAPVFLCADIEHLPFKANSIDYFISNMSMQWCDNLSALFNGAYQSLKPGGQFSFTTLGPKSLYELKTAWQQADNAQGKATQHVNDFHSQAIVATHAKQAGFTIEYAQSRAHSVEYPSVKALLLDLKRVGAHNMSSQQTQGLMGKSHFSAMLHAYNTFKTPKSTFPLTYEMLFFTLKKN